MQASAGDGDEFRAGRKAAVGDGQEGCGRGGLGRTQQSKERAIVLRRLINNAAWTMYAKFMHDSSADQNETVINGVGVHLHPT